MGGAQSMCALCVYLEEKESKRTIRGIDQHDVANSIAQNSHHTTVQARWKRETGSKRTIRGIDQHDVANSIAQNSHHTIVQARWKRETGSNPAHTCNIYRTEEFAKFDVPPVGGDHQIGSKGDIELVHRRAIAPL